MHYLKNYINQILPTAENEKSQGTKFNLEVGDVILRHIDVSVLCHHTLLPNSETIWCPYLFSCLATILIVFSLWEFLFLYDVILLPFPHIWRWMPTLSLTIMFLIGLYSCMLYCYRTDQMVYIWATSCFYGSRDAADRDTL